MKNLSLAVASTAFALSFSAQAATLGVDGKANLFAAGQAAVTAPGGGGGGLLPPSFSFVPGAGQVLTFSSVAGLTDCCFGSPDMNADGNTNVIGPITQIGAGNGISGILAPAQMFLAGVFLDNTAPAGAAPASLDFSASALGTGFSTLAPSLRQMFFIGDGLTGTGTGSVQQFFVPTGATRLFLGFADSFAFTNVNHGYYDDNTGELRATFDIRSTVIPVPAAMPLLLTGLGVFGWMARRRSA
jgi:hypothetical protein